MIKAIKNYKHELMVFLLGTIIYTYFLLGLIAVWKFFSDLTNLIYMV